MGPTTTRISKFKG